MSSVFLSGPSVRAFGEVPEAPHRFYQPAAAGAGEPVQAQQVPVQTQTLRGGHFAHADRNAGERATLLATNSLKVKFHHGTCR